MRSAVAPLQERLDAIHSTFHSTESLAPTNQVLFLRAAAAIATNRTEDVRLRTDAIWALAGTAMRLRQENTWSQEELVRSCAFLMSTAAATNELPEVRRISIAALGDLGLQDAVPVIREIMRDPSTINSPSLGRPAAIALAQLAPKEAVEPIAALMATTTNAAVFGSAAYALGTTQSTSAIPVLVQHRLRLGDNLSVDNAIEASRPVILAMLQQHSEETVLAAIEATRSLWRQEDKQHYRPALIAIVADAQVPELARQRALARLIEDANDLPLQARKERIAEVLPVVENVPAFEGQVMQMRKILAAEPLPAIPEGASIPQPQNDREEVRP